MPKLKVPLISLEARGRLGKLLALAKRGGRNIIERRPIPTDAKSPNQLFIRHMFTKCVDLWHLLSEAEQQEWESSARSRHMTGYAWYISQCLRPNPGIYLPLQGGTMTGDIDMTKNRLLKLPAPIDGQEADTKAARDAAIAAALADPFDVHLYGYDGANWQRLTVWAAWAPFLKVSVHCGAEPVHIANIVSPSLVSTLNYRMMTANTPYLWGTADFTYAWKSAMAVPDGSGGSDHPVIGLMGFNGATWERLRSYPTGTLKVGRAEIGLLDLRRVAVGQVKNAPGKLYWIQCNPSAGNSVWELSDDLDGLSAVLIDGFHTTRESHHFNLDPPMEFSTGIYLKTFTNMTALTFGYK